MTDNPKPLDIQRTEAAKYVIEQAPFLVEQIEQFIPFFNEKSLYKLATSLYNTLTFIYDDSTRVSVDPSLTISDTEQEHLDRLTEKYSISPKQSYSANELTVAFSVNTALTWVSYSKFQFKSLIFLELWEKFLPFYKQNRLDNNGLHMFIDTAPNAIISILRVDKNLKNFKIALEILNQVYNISKNIEVENGKSNWLHIYSCTTEILSNYCDMEIPKFVTRKNIFVDQIFKQILLEWEEGIVTSNQWMISVQKILLTLLQCEFVKATEQAMILDITLNLFEKIDVKNYDNQDATGPNIYLVVTAILNAKNISQHYFDKFIRRIFQIYKALDLQLEMRNKFLQIIKGNRFKKNNFKLLYKYLCQVIDAKNDMNNDDIRIYSEIVTLVIYHKYLDKKQYELLEFEENSAENNLVSLCLDDDSPVNYFIREGNRSVVKKLISNKYIDLEQLSKSGIYPISLMITNEMSDLVKLLLENEKINPWNIIGANGNGFGMAVITNNTELIDKYMSLMPHEMNNSQKKYLGDALIQAMEVKNNRKLINLLIRRVEDVDILYTEFDWSLLHFAAFSGEFAAFKKLLLISDTYDKEDNWGRTAVDVASSKIKRKILNFKKEGGSQ